MAGAPCFEDTDWSAPALRRAWNCDILRTLLEPLLPGVSIEVAERLGSTNSELLARLRRARDDRPAGVAPCLLAAVHQTAGRGRLDRQWHASAGASLTFSLALPFRRDDGSGLSLAVGLALAEALDPQDRWPASGPRLGLKWPNDLMFRAARPGDPDRKLGGILIETLSVGGQRVAVVGIGLNVRPQHEPQADSVNPYACLSEFRPEASAPDVLARIVVPLAQALLDFDRDGFAPCQERYARRDVLLGQRVSAWSAGSNAGAVDGTADGVEADGALRLEVDGAIRRVVGGEVSVRRTIESGATGASSFSAFPG